MNVSSIAVAFASTVLLGGACVGMGAAMMAGARILDRLSRLESVAWAFVLGFGMLGWLTCFILAARIPLRPILWGLIVISCCGMFTLRATSGADYPRERGNWLLYTLILGLILIGVVDIAESLAPPADADSLAYHFALAKQFLVAGRLEFVPRAVDGAVPLLVQMVWMIALALGGEQGMTLFAGVSGWMLGLLTFVAARPYMSRNWALACVLVIVSTPAMLYAGGTGQIEPRLALFALVAALGLQKGIQLRNLGFVGVAGIAAGFAAASKYTGPLVVVAAFVPLLVWWRSPRILTCYAGAAFVAGFQWYVWNWWNTGDPLFPVLTQFLDPSGHGFWSSTQIEMFRAHVAESELPLPVNPLWLAIYPFHATLQPAEAIESGRTGLGPYGWLTLPFAVMASWRYRRRLADHPLAIIAVMAISFYVIWYLAGVSQRVRHLLTVWPMVAVCVTAIASRWAQDAGMLRPLVGAIGVTVTFQLAGQFAFGAAYVRHFYDGDTRHSFLERYVENYGLVAPTEQVMRADDKVLVDQRQLVYLFDKPVFYYHYFDQTQIVMKDAIVDRSKFLHELQAQGVTLLLVPDAGSAEPTDLVTGAHALAAAGCIMSVKELESRHVGSRTLGPAGGEQVSATLYRVNPSGCVS